MEPQSIRQLQLLEMIEIGLVIKDLPTDLVVCQSRLDSTRLFNNLWNLKRGCRADCRYDNQTKMEQKMDKLQQRQVA